MHVCLSLLTLFPGRVGGSETNVRGVLGAFAAGHGPERLTVLGNRHMGAEYAGWPVTPVPAYRPGNSNLTRFIAMNVGRIHPEVSGREYDVVHYPVTVPVPAIDGPARVVTLLDVQHHELPQMFSRGERRLRSWAYDGAARGADLVITISEHAKRGIVEHVGVPAERIEVIGLGVDHERFTPEGPARDDLGDYVLYPANLWPHKNHDRLLDAWRAIDDLTLVLTGQTFGRTIAQDRVVHLGHVPHDELPALYRGARAVVFPSLFEGFGVPVLEAMACGTPVAASDRGALAEVAGGAARTFDPDDPAAIVAAVRAAVGDDTLRAAGLAQAARFTWTAAADAHVAAYRRALDYAGTPIR
ncbi:MAG: glycosyltransferase family 4 protein [Solirubrobacteraceae bacterium]